MTAPKHQITCIVPDGSDPDRAIDAVGGSGWQLSLEDAIAAIETGRYAFYTHHGGVYADVIVVTRNGRKHLRTTSDSTTSNNLLQLAYCPA
ncbi:DUF3892 domain-containing protein [Synechococcus moorigangaii CMS01]|nr:DUF3892 domain-containing protein [Synechococcus moorigangaii CMS01]